MSEANGKWRNRIVGYEDVSVDELTANPANWRIHPQHQQDSLLGVLHDVGIVQNIIVNQRSGYVVDGHMRVLLAMKENQATVPVTYVDLSDAEEALVLSSIDPISALAVADKEKLDALLKQVSTDSPALQEMLANLATEAGLYLNGDEPPEDKGAQTDRAAELQQEYGTEVGQLWEIGKHRLLIADCTIAENVERLMQGKRADAVLTDSPYGIDREGIVNDDEAGLRNLFDGAIRNLPIDNAVVINFQSPRLFHVWLDAVRDAGHKFERLLWMYKPNDVTFPWQGWILKSEVILLSSVGKPEYVKAEPYAHDCYTANWDASNKVDIEGWHATIKPLTVIKDLVSRVGNLIYDPFLGSGTTMVAAHQLNRVCYGMEVHAPYGAVILDRMSKLGVSPRRA